MPFQRSIARPNRLRNSGERGKRKNGKFFWKYSRFLIPVSCFCTLLDNSPQAGGAKRQFGEMFKKVSKKWSKSGSSKVTVSKRNASFWALFSGPLKFVGHLDRPIPVGNLKMSQTHIPSAKITTNWLQTNRQTDRQSNLKPPNVKSASRKK